MLGYLRDELMDAMKEGAPDGFGREVERYMGLCLAHYYGTRDPLGWDDPLRHLVRSIETCRLLIERNIQVKWVCYARADDLADEETERLWCTVTDIAPERVLTRPISDLSSVVLPLPDGPISARKSPAGTSRSSSCARRTSTCASTTEPPPWRWWRWSRRRATLPGSR